MATTAAQAKTGQEVEAQTVRRLATGQMMHDFPQQIASGEMVGYKVRWALAGLHVEAAPKSVMVAFRAEGGPGEGELFAVEAQYRLRTKQHRRVRNRRRRHGTVWQRVV